MLLINRSTLLSMSGIIWFCIGSMLLNLGINLMLEAAIEATPTLLPKISALMGITWVTLSLVSIALLVGYLKGKFLLIKTVKKETSRILSLPDPVKLKNLYHKNYIFLIVIMISLSLFIKISNISMTIRALIDIAIGSALLQGAIFYLRYANICRKQKI